MTFFRVIPSCSLARRRRAGGAGRTSPCRGVGQRPTPSNLPIPFFILLNRRAPARRPPLCPSVLSVLLCVLRNLRFHPSCPFVVLRVLRVFLKTFHLLPPPHPSPRRGAPFSVLRSLFSGHASAPWSFVLFVTAPQGKPSTGSPPPHPSRACRAFCFLWSNLEVIATKDG